jgi:hypothetical protein
MVFVILEEFLMPKTKVAELCVGIERAVFERPSKPGEHMKPLYIRGHLDGIPVGRMMVDEGVSINIMPVSLFEKLRHKDEDLKQTNICLSGFSGEPAEARGIVSKELTVGSKTVPTAFFIVDVKGWYNVLLGQDWIHVNSCVPSMLHQCVIEWVGDKVEVINAYEIAYVAMVEPQVDVHGGSMKCLSGRDLTDYDYVSVGKEEFMPISVKPMVNMTQLNNGVL